MEFDGEIATDGAGAENGDLHPAPPSTIASVSNAIDGILVSPSHDSPTEGRVIRGPEIPSVILSI
jgi:hypothetical protein